MTARPDAMLHFVEVARGVPGLDACYPVVQKKIKGDDGKREFLFPSVVYYAVGEDTIETLSEGVHQSATVIRFEVRDAVYSTTVRLSGEIVAALRKDGRLLSLNSLVDDYDGDLSIYRRIRSVTVR